MLKRLASTVAAATGTAVPPAAGGDDGGDADGKHELNACVSSLMCVCVVVTGAGASAVMEDDQGLDLQARYDKKVSELKLIDKKFKGAWPKANQKSSYICSFRVGGRVQKHRQGAQELSGACISPLWLPLLNYLVLFRKLCKRRRPSRIWRTPRACSHTTST